MPRVGSSRMQHLGVGEQPLADDDLLLVAAGQRAHLLAEPGHPHAELLGDRAPRRLGWPFGRPARRGSRPAWSTRPRFSSTDWSEHQPLALAVLGHQPDPGRHRGVHVVPRGSGAPVDAHGARRRTGRPRRRHGATSVRPAPTSPAMPTTSPARTSKPTSWKTPSRVSPSTVRSARAGLGALPGVLLLDGAAHHEPDELVLGRARRAPGRRSCRPG